MRVRLLGNMDDGRVILPAGQVVDMADDEASYLVSVGAAEAVTGAADVEDAKPAKRTRTPKE